jgi:hypothetical protein
MSDSEGTQKPSHHTKYWIVGTVAAAVSAATVAYVFYLRSKHLKPQVEGVQQLLDRCHDQVRSIEDKLGQLNELATRKATSTELSR